MQGQNIIDLIEKNPLTKLSKVYKGIFIKRIQSKFSETEQNIFLSNFYYYLNYDCNKDYIVDFDSIWKWLGFSRKDPCKDVLIKNFKENVHYKITTKDDSPPISGESIKFNKRGDYNRETILLTVNTFKKLCLKSRTDKADEIHDYFIKLEETLQEVIDEESTEMRNQLIEKNDLLIEQKVIINEQQRNIRVLQKAKITKYDKKEYLYIGSDREDRCVIGISRDMTKRETQYILHNPNFKINYLIPCRDYILTEKIIKKILSKYTTDRSNEWFNINYDKLKIIVDVVIYILDDNIKNNDKFENVYQQFLQINNLIFNNPINDSILFDIPKINETKVEIKDKIIDKIEINDNKYFTNAIYKNFINECCIFGNECDYRTSGKDLLLKFKEYHQVTEFRTDINKLFDSESTSNKTSFGFINEFKNEFYNNIEIILNTKLTNYTINNCTKVVFGFKSINIKIVEKEKKEYRYFDKNIYDNFFNYINVTNNQDDKIKTTDIADHFSDYIIKNNIYYENILPVNKNTILKTEIISIINKKYNISEHKSLSFQKTQEVKDALKIRYTTGEITKNQYDWCKRTRANGFYGLVLLPIK